MNSRLFKGPSRERERLTYLSMIRTKRLVLASLLLVGSKGLSGATPTAGGPDSLVSCVLPSMTVESAIVAMSSNSARGVERLRGAAARAHLRNLYSKHPSRFSRAEHVLASKSLRKTEEVVVLRSITLDSPESRGPKVEAVPLGEIVFVSWDDGDPSTWEGAIYIASYATARDALTAVQFLVSTGEPETLWEETVDGEDSSNEGNRLLASDGMDQPETERRSAQSVDSDRETLDEDPSPTPTPTPTPEPSPTPQPKSPARLWVECAAKGCGLGAVGCAVAGTAWPACFELTCGLAGMGCALDAVFNMIP